MRVSIVQAPIGPMLMEENRKTIFHAMEAALKDDPDVIVLPEMWNTGFYPDKFSADPRFNVFCFQLILQEHGFRLRAADLVGKSDFIVAVRLFNSEF